MGHSKEMIEFDSTLDGNDAFFASDIPSIVVMVLYRSTQLNPINVSSLLFK